MTRKKKICVIINPVSGIGKQKTVEGLLEKVIDKNRVEYEISYTKEKGHAHRIAAEAAIKKTDIVAVCGGDGSVNEAGSALLHSETALAIIPAGSGNGLARHLKIPLKTEKAIALLNNHREKVIDTGTVNEYRFMGIAGVGFDAHIAHKFDELGQRGFRNYAKLVLKEYREYEPQLYEIVVNGRTEHRKALMVTAANSSQFGNGAKVAPKTVIDDGKFTVVISSKFPVSKLPFALLKLLTGAIRPSREITMIETEGLVLRSFTGWLHLDGEPRYIHDKTLEFGLDSKSLKVLVEKI